MYALDDLETEVRKSLYFAGPDPSPWTPARKGVDQIVTIVGAGQSGLAAAFALQRRGIKAFIIDAEEEGSEGVWRLRARMPTLRTPKERPGPELGVAPLSYRAWYTAQFGDDEWERLGRPSRESWAEYLTWYRKILQLKVNYNTRLERIDQHGENLKLTLESDGQKTQLVTRKLVLAMGLSAGGGLNIPAIISDNVPKRFFTHTNDIIDFGALRNKRIGVLGASASGFDAACTALEAGAHSASVFCRGSDLARGTRYRWADFPGADYFHLLPDSDRWRIARLYLARGNHPPATAIARAKAARGFSLHVASPWERVEVSGDEIAVRVGDTDFTFDFIIAATGFRHDPRLAHYLKPLVDNVALWKHRYSPALDLRDPDLENYPYLGDCFQFQELVAGQCPCVKNIHVLNTTALLSFLRIVGDIKCLGFTSERLSAGIVRDLFLADREVHLRTLSLPPIDELTGDDYQELITYRKGADTSSA
jgi:cation diffusion facilitator CzcD-associated flavoprotein CzcO